MSNAKTSSSALFRLGMIVVLGRPTSRRQPTADDPTLRAASASRSAAGSAEVKESQVSYDDPENTR
jgi:hypothetical protein